VKAQPWAWSVLQQGGRQVASYAIFLVLARLLTPRDFGLVALATAWVGILGVFSEVGFGSALIQRHQVTPAHLSSTFFLNVTIGLGITLLGMAASWPLASVLDAPAVQPVMLALSAGFLINALGLTHLALAYRDLRFKELAIRDLIAVTVGGAVGVAAAWKGYGVWSLVAQTLVTSVLASALLWGMLSWRPSAGEVSRGALADLWGYGSKLFAFNLFKYLAQNLDKLLVSVLAGPVLLGLYNFAQKLVMIPVQNLAGAVGNWLFPRLARLQGDTGRSQATYFQTSATITLAVFPVLGVLAVVAKPAIPLVFGVKWEPAAEVVPLFAVVGAAIALMSMAGPLLKALDRPGWLFNYAVFFSALTAGALAVGSRWGLVGFGTGMAAAHVLGLLVLDAVTRRLLHVPAGAWLGTALPALGKTVLAAGTAALILALPGMVSPARVGLACAGGVAWHAWALARAVKTARSLGPTSEADAAEAAAAEADFFSSSTGR
jgi:O-antigen/teichoic acid export membrane protein